MGNGDNADWHELESREVKAEGSVVRHVLDSTNFATGVAGVSSLLRWLYLPLTVSLAVFSCVLERHNLSQFLDLPVRLVRWRSLLLKQRAKNVREEGAKAHLHRDCRLSTTFSRHRKALVLRRRNLEEVHRANRLRGPDPVHAKHLTLP